MRGADDFLFSHAIDISTSTNANMSLRSYPETYKFTFISSKEKKKLRKLKSFTAFYNNCNRYRNQSIINTLRKCFQLTTFNSPTLSFSNYK